MTDDLASALAKIPKVRAIAAALTGQDPADG